MKKKYIVPSMEHIEIVAGGLMQQLSRGDQDPNNPNQPQGGFTAPARKLYV